MRLRLAFASLCLLSACFDPGDLTDEEVAAEESAIYVSSGTVWQQLSIPVCWDNDSAANATERGWVKSQIEATWEAVSRVDFTGWGHCATQTAKGVHLYIQDVTPITAGAGLQLDGKYKGVKLNFTFNNYMKEYCQQPANREICIRGTAVHEFGHVLSIAHEHLRPDKPAGCVADPGGPQGDYAVSTYDPDSVMNYCSTHWIDGVLSPGDIAGVRQVYGSTTFAGNRKAGVTMPNGRTYFFNGGEYTRFQPGATIADSGYPKAIASNWGGWPPSWTGGIDAAVNWGNGKAYFFRGGQYIRVNAANGVEQQPLPMVGNWKGWPPTWTSIDTVVNWGNGNVYFFRGSQYLRFSIPKDKVDQNPLPIAGNWPGLFTSNIDHSVTPGDGMTYFFKGTQVSTYHMADDLVVEGPVGIVGRWVGVAF